VSEGPIRAWRKSHEPARVSTPNAARVCYQAPGSPRAYCGRRLMASTTRMTGASCADCAAALHADGLLPPEKLEANHE